MLIAKGGYMRNPLANKTIWRDINNMRNFSRWSKRILNLNPLPLFTSRIGILFLVCFVSACAPDIYNIPSDSYIEGKRNYTYAIYSNEHRLLSHPLKDLKAQMKLRSYTNNEKITDIYIISHGWNYTAPEAVANFHNYFELVNDFNQQLNKKNHYPDCKNEGTLKKISSLAKVRERKFYSVKEFFSGHSPCRRPFNPFFILVTWVSTSRPTSDLASAILPFQLHDALRPITWTLDNGPLFLMTAWKQSLNSTTIALGKRFPNKYLYADWDVMPFYTESKYFQDMDWGRDLPLSALIYELLWRKSSDPNRNPLEEIAENRKCRPTLRKPSKEDRLLNDIDIHLVGHSYGAKLVTLAGMEALRRWVLVDQKRISDWNREKTHCRNIYYDTLSDYGQEKVWPNEIEVGKKIDEIYEKYRSKLNGSLIESLVMINPAMHPGELWYPTHSIGGFPSWAPASVLRFIPRKAIVYTKYDLPNGALFTARELLLNTQMSQNYQSILHDNDFHLEQSSPITRGVLSFVDGAINGPLSAAFSMVYGALTYALTAVMNIPGDLTYHVENNDTFGDPEENQLFNVFDFFLPIIPAGWFNENGEGFTRDEDKQGVLRLTRPALGKTGLSKIAVGRESSKVFPEFIGIPINPNLWGLQGFYRDHKGDRIDVDYDPQQFCQFATKPYLTNSLPSDQADINKQNNQRRQRIYSFNASSVYDDTSPLAFGHDDVRERKIVRCKMEGENRAKWIRGFNQVVADYGGLQKILEILEDEWNDTSPFSEILNVKESSGRPYFSKEPLKDVKDAKKLTLTYTRPKFYRPSKENLSPDEIEALESLYPEFEKAILKFFEQYRTQVREVNKQNIQKSLDGNAKLNIQEFRICLNETCMSWQEKRRYSFNFIFNFTKTKFEDQLAKKY